MLDKPIIRKIYLNSELLQTVVRNLRGWRKKIYLKFNPRVIANISYRTVFKKNVNWDNPRDLIEKILWLQLFSDTRLWTRCSDKYLVRDYVSEKGCADVLNDLYGMWHNVNEIEWVKLPNSFVLKANNSCGEVILVKNKKNLNILRVKKRLTEWLNNRYGHHGAQMHYTKIKPCIIAEKLFVNNKDLNKSLIDYKIWSFHGEPECVLVVYNRSENDYSLSLYDLNWRNISEKAFNKSNPHYCGTDVPRPKSLNKMLEVTKKLSKDIPQVRVDFYDIEGEAVFGEMTFTTGFGYFSEEYYEYLGTKIDLRRVEMLPKMNTV